MDVNERYRTNLFFFTVKRSSYNAFKNLIGATDQTSLQLRLTSSIHALLVMKNCKRSEKPSISINFVE